MFHKPLPKHRLFFALIPPLQLARQIANAAHWFATEGTPVRADRLHVTVLIFDDRDDIPPAVLVDALRAIGSNTRAAPIEMTLDYVSGGAHSIALWPQHRLKPLDTLQRALVAACGKAGIAPRRDWHFDPHVTLGYREGRAFGERIAPVIWQADELVLIDSHLGRTRHEVLGRWTLSEPDDAQLTLF